MSEDYEEVTLADLVDILLRRKLVLLVTFALCLGGAFVITASADPEPAFEGHASQLLLVEPQLVLAHLMAGEQEGDVNGVGYTWDAELLSGDASQGRSPARTQSAAASEDNARLLIITVKAPDATTAAAAPSQVLALVEATENLLRERIQQQQFDQYYSADGKSEADARRLAQERAESATLWSPASVTQVDDATDYPNTKLTLALGLVLGLMLGVFVAFTAEWVVNYRARK